MFKRVVSDSDIAGQIATLLNSHNRLGTYFTQASVLATKRDYIVQTVGPLVAACVMIEKQSYNMTEIKHLVVSPAFRRQGLAKILILAGIKQAVTPLVYAMVRHDNLSSIKAFESCGLLNVGKYTTGKRDVLCFITTGPKWKKEVVETVSPTNNNLYGR